MSWLLSPTNASSVSATDESADTTCFPLFSKDATGDITAHTNAGLTFNASTGDLVSTLIAGIANANLLDKSAAETITGAWSFEQDVAIKIGKDLKIYDAANTNYINIDASTIPGYSGIWMHVVPGGTNYALLSDGSNTWINGSTQVKMRLAGIDKIHLDGNGLEILAGGSLEIYDLSGTDWVTFSHDGTDFNVAHLNTTDVNYTLADNYKFSDGAIVRIYDSADTEFNQIDCEQTIAGWGGIWLRTAGGAPAVGNYCLLSDGTSTLINAPTGGAVHTRINNVSKLTVNTSSVTGAVEIRGDAGVTARGGTWLTAYDSVNTDFGYLVHTGSNFQMRTKAAGADNIQIFSDGGFTSIVGNTFRVQDAGATDSINFSHDGTDANTTFTATTDWNISSASFYKFDNDVSSSGGAFFTRGPLSNDGIAGQFTFVDQQATYGRLGSYSWTTAQYEPLYIVGEEIRLYGGTAGTANIALIDSNSLNIRGGNALEIYDSTNVDYLAMSHNGTDFTFNFVNTGALHILNLSQAFFRDGVDVRIYDSGDTDYAELSHDGTDFNFNLVNTTDLNFTGPSFFKFDDDVQITTGGLQVTGLVTSTGVNEIFTFMDVSGGGGRVGAFNWATSIYQQLTINGRPCIINTRGDDFRVDDGATTKIHFDQNLSKFDILTGLDLRIRDAGSLFVYDATDVDSAEFSHDGTDFNINFSTTTDCNFTGLAAGGFLRQGTAPIANATLTNVSEDAADTIDYQYMNGIAFKDGSVGVTYTLEASGVTTFEVGATCQFVNAHATTGDITINEGTGTTLYLLTGATVTDTAGGCTLSPGGYATVYRHSATVYYVFGSGVVA